MTERTHQHAEPTDDIRRQARAWLRLLASTTVTEVDAQAFRRWLDARASHKVAFNEVKHQWTVMRPAAGEYLRTRPDAMPSRSGAGRARQPSRRVFLGAAMGTAAVAAVAVALPPGGRWPSFTEWGADDRTVVGEQRIVTLAQRATVTLNTQTSIRRQSAHGQVVGFDLLAGEAAIDLLASESPFSVAAGAGTATARSGQFEVRFINGKVCVTCLSGGVRVAHPAGRRALTANQQMIYDSQAVSGIATVEPSATTAWRRGEIVFDQTRLSDVLVEINRYRSGRVMLMNAAARDNRVTGRFMIASLDAALAQLVNTFDLSARSLPGGLLLLS